MTVFSRIWGFMLLNSAVTYWTVKNYKRLKITLLLVAKCIGLLNLSYSKNSHKQDKNIYFISILNAILELLERRPLQFNRIILVFNITFVWDVCMIIYQLVTWDTYICLVLKSLFQCVAWLWGLGYYGVPKYHIK